MVLVLSPALPSPGDWTGRTKTQMNLKENFDAQKPGELPEGWKPDATNPKGPLAQWKVLADAYAPSKPNVLSITKIPDTDSGHFNLFWQKDLPFRDVALEVTIRADSGQADQGGGLIWRALDARNYYLARYNPLESNFRLYYVKDGRRVQLADAGNLDVKTAQWFTIKVVAVGESIEVYLNGKALLKATDNTFPAVGGVGLWTKADAASSFDDFSAQPADPR